MLSLGPTTTNIPYYARGKEMKNIVVEDNANST
jgi:hypothetical protein